MWERFWSKKMSWEFFYYVAKPFEGKKSYFPQKEEGGNVKMAFEEVKSNPVFGFENEGDKIEGKYIGTEDGQYGKNFLIECKSGETFTVFGKTVLTTKMLTVKSGSKVRITYLGEVKSKKGGTMYKDFKVEVEK